MARKVAIIFGSPTKNSNTHILVKEAIKGLDEAGAESEVFFLNDMDMRGCQSCLSCKTNGTTECAFDDDMQIIYRSMEAADGIIVATPIYFHDVTAQTKMWEDRLFPYLGPDFTGLMPGHKRASFIFTQNRPDPELFLEHIRTFMGVVGMVGFEVKDYMVAADLARGMKPMVSENKRYMTRAHELGRNLFAGRANGPSLEPI